MGKGALNIVVPFLIKSSADSEASNKNKSTRAYQKEIFCGPIYASISVIPEILSGYLHGNLFFKPISEIKLSRTVKICQKMNMVIGAPTGDLSPGRPPCRSIKFIGILMRS